MHIAKIWVIGLACCLGFPAWSSCVVTKVVDGDTLHLTCAGTAHKVRLLGFDTPEVFHPHCALERAAADQATQVLLDLVASGPVTSIAFNGKDRYGRDLASLGIAGHDVAAVMLASGLARPYAGHKHPDWCSILQDGGQAPNL